MTRRATEPSFVPTSIEQPHSPESERAVLGSVLLDGRVMGQVVSQLTVEHFFLESHQIIYRAMLDLHAKGTFVDLLTLQTRLEQQGGVERIGGLTYLATLDLDLPDIGRLDNYVEIIVERATRRSILRLAGDAMRDGFGSAEVEETLARIQGELPGLLAATSRPRLRSMVDIVSPLLEQVEEAGRKTLQGLPTGYGRLDDLTAGLHAGHLIVIAGRPGLGKSAFAANVAQNVAIRQRRPVGIWSLEMTEKELALRMLCSESDVPSAIVRKGFLSRDQWGRLIKAGRTLAESPLYVDDTAALSITHLEGRIRRAVEDQGIVLAVVDYLQLVHPRPGRREENRASEVGRISGALKDLAKSLGIPVIALSQLSREVTKRSGFRPSLADLRESGAIEQDADVVAFVHREHAYNQEAPPAGAEVIVAKNRHGGTGDLPLVWVGETTTFRESSAEAPAPSYYGGEDPF